MSCLGAFAGANTISNGISPQHLIEAGHWKRARALVEQRLRSNPNDAGANYLLSKIRDSFGDYAGAIDAARVAAGLEPHSADYLGQLAEAYARLADQSSFLKGFNLVRLTRKDIAAALRINPNHRDTLLVEMMLDWKAPRIAGGDKAQARQIARQLTRTDPVWGYLAEARLSQDESDDTTTESSLRRAVEISPWFYDARALLAEFYCCKAHRKNPEKAQREARAVMQIDPGRVSAYSVLASVYARQQRWEDLDAVLAQTERAVPDDLAPYYQAAEALIETRQDFPRAARYLRKYLNEEPEGRAPTRAEARALLAEVI